MDEKLQILSKQWKNMPRNNEAEMIAADEFYQESIMPLATAKFVETFGVKDKVYDLMFATMGTSWQPIALSVLAKRPARVVLLTTPDVLDQVERAKTFMADCGFTPVYQVEFISKADSVPLMQAIRKVYEQEKPGRVCMDITGGTKAMSAAAAMMAAQLGIELSYVESRYLPVYRRPEPGSEQLVSLVLPQDIAK